MTALADYAGPTDSRYKKAVRNLALGYDEAVRYAEEQQPYWLSLRHPRDGEMHWDLFDYFPAAHYADALEKHHDQYRADGGYTDLHNGKKQSKVYYWLDPDTGAALYHTGVNEEKTVPFFPDETSAEDYLEQRADAEGGDQFENLSLYRARTRKVGDAVDVLTDQSGIEDFMPDGGRPEDPHQIPNPTPETVWFWYNPSMDSIVQEEVDPYDVRGVFESEPDANRFLDWYADQYGVADTSHLELYFAEIQLEGYGRKHFRDDETGSDEEVPEQVDFAAFQEEE